MSSSESESESDSSDSSTQKCNECNTNDITVECSDCNEYFCDDCSNKCNFCDSDFCTNCDELQYISSTGKEDDYSNDFNRMFCIRCIKYNYDTIAPWDNDDSSDSSSSSSGNDSD